MKKIVAFIFTLLAAMTIAGCGESQGSESTEASQQTEEKQELSVTVEISNSKSGEQIADEEITVTEGTTLMELMKENYEIEETDGFINAIEGVAGSESEKMAWMYTINGEQAMVGANEYELEQGDEIVFEYQSWE